MGAPFDRPLPEPPAGSQAIAFRASAELPAVRNFVAQHATTAGLCSARAADFVLAVHEAAANSIRHSGGSGTVMCWHEPDAVVCEVVDRGRITDPLAGRERPPSDRIGGRGLWLANQLCDLVQVRTFASGGAIRLHMRRGGTPTSLV
jgi:anti-sigma regulatory factor (Ser/Thr protein kinase)